VSWQLASLLVLGVVLLAGFLWYERQRPPARVLALVAALAALAVVGRLAFAAIPNVKPTTDIVLFAGFALGAAPGFAVGAVTAIASNVFLSQGPWTAWQMVGWGAVGVAGAGLARALRGRNPGRLPLAAACGLAGFVFGAWMDVYQWTLAARQDLPSYLAVSASSLPYNVAHATGNVVFALLLGPPFVRALRRYRRRFQVRWEPSAVAAASTVAALALASGLGMGASHRPPAASASPAATTARVSASVRAVRYLRRAQNRDGGFGGARGQASTQLFTGWSALGLAAARRNPRDVHRRRGHSITTYIRRHARSLGGVGGIERTILVLRAAGLSPRAFAGRNLLHELLSRRRSDGSWSRNVGWTGFGVLALKAARSPAVGSSANWLVRAQNGDGGFGYTASAPSDADDTGAVLEALAAAGLRGSGSAARAAAYLRRTQNADGGFAQMAGGSSNSQSTAWAAQGLLAVGSRDPVRRALRYLRRRQRRDGAIRYARGSSQTPVWVTGEALAALRRKPFPLASVPRRHRHHRSASASASGGNGSTSSPTSEHRSATSSAPTRRSAGVRPLARTRIEPLGSGPHREVARHKPGKGPPAWLVTLLAVAAAALLLIARRYLPDRLGGGAWPWASRTARGR
jgi:energy-coupling factor transport system substrate-specific component